MNVFSKDKVFVVAEIGPNHNGSIEIAKKLIDAAKDAGADAVKFQKKTPHLSLPQNLWFVKRETPFGRMEYLEYRKKIEFGENEYDQIDEHCRKREIIWFASPWDKPSVYFLKRYDLPLIKVASASITNMALLDEIRSGWKRVILSTGMSTKRQIETAVSYFQDHDRETGVLACRSTYPAPIADLNIRRIETLQRMFPWATVGYSGHEVGLWTTLAAVGFGARIVERHITLDRAMKGSDHAASLEPRGLFLLTREIRNFEKALGDGSFDITEEEEKQARRLRTDR